MSKYIDADELKNDLEHRLIRWSEPTRGMFPTYGESDMPDIIDSQPTAEVIKRGRWIIDRKFGNDVMSDEQMVICSVCGKGIFWGKQNYCPNCGAKMDEECENESR